MLVARNFPVGNWFSFTKKSMVILVVDDDPDDSQILVELVLELRQDISFILTGSANECFEQVEIKGIVPDLIFLDGILPGVTSKDCLDRLKNNEQLKATKIVIYSGFKRNEVDVFFGKNQLSLHKTSSTGELKSNLQALLETN